MNLFGRGRDPVRLLAPWHDEPALRCWKKEHSHIRRLTRGAATREHRPGLAQQFFGHRRIPRCDPASRRPIPHHRFRYSADEVVHATIRPRTMAPAGMMVSFECPARTGSRTLAVKTSPAAAILVSIGVSMASRIFRPAGRGAPGTPDPLPAGSTSEGSSKRTVDSAWYSWQSE